MVILQWHQFYLATIHARQIRTMITHEYVSSDSLFSVTGMVDYVRCARLPCTKRYYALSYATVHNIRDYTIVCV